MRQNGFDQNQLMLFRIRVSIELKSMDSGYRLPVFSMVAMLLIMVLGKLLNA